MLDRRWMMASLLGAALGCEAVPQGTLDEKNAQAWETLQQMATGEPPVIDFTTKPSYLPINVIVLTLDDGPDTVNTPKVLDTLKEKGVKVTVFINTINTG